MAQQEIEFPSRKIRLLYSSLFIPLLKCFFGIASLFNSKARRGFRGRKNLFSELGNRISKIPEGQRIWIHASSLGEFEQAKPIIEILKKAGYRIVVTFFSPSGYEHSLNYLDADLITYIPLDSRKNAEKFVEIVRPRAVVVMRYDLWLNHLIAAKEQGAKVVVADATFSIKMFQRPKLLKEFYRQVYGLADLVLTTNSDNKRLFDSFLGKKVIEVGGDTRFDRVYSRSVANNVTQKIPLSIDRSKRIVMILGSTWRQDTEVLRDGITRLVKEFPSLLVVIVPHEPTGDEVRRLVEQFPCAKVLSAVGETPESEVAILIVDRVGILTQLYVLGHVAYVGGGFGAGVHSVLEPAVYGMPIVTGPRIERSDEAMQLMKNGALFIVKDSTSAHEAMLKLVADEAARKTAGGIAMGFVKRNIGASALVAERIMKICEDRSSI